MSLAKRMQQTATRLLNKFDESNGRIKLVRKGASYFDPILGEEVISPDVTIDLVGVTVVFDQSLVNGTTIQAGDVMVIATSAEKPTIQDKVLIDGVQWSIVSQPVVDYTGVAICYKIHCTK